MPNDDYDSALQELDAIPAQAPAQQAPVKLDMPDYDAALAELDGIGAAPEAGNADVPKASIGQRGLDVATSLLKGAIGVPQAVVGVADLAQTPGLYAGQVGRNIYRGRPLNTPDALGPGLIGRTVGKVADFEGAKTELDKLYSPQQQEANRRVREAQGIVPTVIESVKNPSTIVQGVAESLPVMGAGGVVGRGLGALAGLSTAIPGAIGEGVMQAGSMTEQLRQASPTGSYTPGQAALAATSGFLTGLISAKGGKLAQRWGIADPDTWAASGLKAATPALRKNWALRILTGAATEGVIEEAPQSALEQVAQNIATGQPWFAGVDKATVQGMLAGMGMGAGANVLAGPTRATDTTTPPPSPDTTGNAEVDRLIEQVAQEDAALAELDAIKPAEQVAGQPITGGIVQPERPDLVREQAQTKADADKMVSSGFARRVSVIGSQATGLARPGSDTDVLIDLGDVALPADTGEAELAVQDLIESKGDGVRVGERDYFFKAGDRYFHLGRGAGPGIVENTEYGKAQAGKPSTVLAERQADAVSEPGAGRVIPLPIASAPAATDKENLTVEPTVKEGLRVEGGETPTPSTADELVKQYDAGEMSAADIYDALRAKTDPTDQEVAAIAAYERGYEEYRRNGMRMDDFSEEYLLRELRKKPSKGKVKAATSTVPQAEQPPKNFKGNAGYHRSVLDIAKNRKEPLNAAAVDAYGIKLPAGYTLQGDRYVYTPSRGPRATDTMGTTPSTPVAPATISAPMATSGPTATGSTTVNAAAGEGSIPSGASNVTPGAPRSREAGGTSGYAADGVSTQRAVAEAVKLVGVDELQRQADAILAERGNMDKNDPTWRAWSIEAAARTVLGKAKYDRFLADNKPVTVNSGATLARALTANPDMDLAGMKDAWLKVAATKVKGALKGKVEDEIKTRAERGAPGKATTTAPQTFAGKVGYRLTPRQLKSATYGLLKDAAKANTWSDGQTVWASAKSTSASNLRAELKRHRDAYMAAEGKTEKAKITPAQRSNMRSTVQSRQMMAGINRDMAFYGAKEVDGVKTAPDAPINEAELEDGDFVRIGNEWYKVNAAADGKTLTDGEKIKLDAFDAVNAKGVINPNSPNYADVAAEHKAQVREEKKAPPALPANGELIDAGFNLVAERPKAAPAPAPAETPLPAQGQPELFPVVEMVKSKDPAKSADAAQEMYGGAAQAIANIRRQLAVIDGDPDQKRAFSKEQRAMLKNVLALLDQRASASPAPDQPRGTTGGPGAAAAQGKGEFLPPARSTESGDYTALRRSVSDMERESLGLPAYAVDAARRFPQVIDSVMERLQATPQYAQELHDELAENPRPVSDAEAATLLILKVQRFNERNAAAQATSTDAAKADPAANKAAWDRFGAAQKALGSVFDVISRSGTETGRALNAFKLAMDEQFNLVEMEQAVRAAQGKDLSADQLAELKKIKAERDAAKADFDAATTRNKELERVVAMQGATVKSLEARLQNQQAEADAKAEAIKAQADEQWAQDVELYQRTLVGNKKQKPPSQRMMDKGDAIMAEVMAEIRAKAAPKMAVSRTDPAVLELMKRYGHGVFLRGDKLFAAWKLKMMTAFGNRLMSSELREIYNASVERGAADIAAEESQKIIEDAKAAPVEGEPADSVGPEAAEKGKNAKLRKTVKQLMNRQAANGVKVVEDAARAVSTLLNNDYPDMTPERVLEYYSDYGIVPPLRDKWLAKLKAQWRNQARSLSKLQTILTELRAPKKTGPQRVKPDARSRELERLVQSEMKRLNIQTVDRETQVASAMQARQTALQNQIEDYDRAVATRERMITNREILPDDAKTSALRKQRDEHRALYEKMFPKQPLTPEQQLNVALKAAARSLIAQQQRLKDAQAGKFGKAEKEAAALPQSDELYALRLEIELVKNDVKTLYELAHPRLSDAERAVESRITRMEAAIKKLDEREAAGDFDPRRSPYVDISGNPRAMAAQEKLANARAKFAVLKEKARRSKMTLLQKISEGAVDIYDLARDVASSGDVSAPGRQGYPLLFINAPIWLKANRAMFGSLNKRQSAIIEQRIRERANYRKGYYRRLKLSVDDGTGNFSRVDDRLKLNIVNMVPGLGASNRAYATFLNVARVELFDYFLSLHPRSDSPTADDINAISEDVNTWTGSGKIPGGASVGLSRFIYAPSFIKASLDIVTGKPLWHGEKATRKLMAMQYAKVLAGTATLVALASAWGGDDDDGVEYDPTSSEFGTVKYGHYRVGLFGFVRPLLTFLARNINGYKKTDKGLIRLREGDLPFWVDEGDVSKKVPYGGGLDQVQWQFLKSKAHPGLGAVQSLLTGRDFSGQPTSRAWAIARMFTPITPQQVYEMSQTENIDAMVVLTILNAFGFDVRPDYTDPVIRENLDKRRKK